MTEFELAHPYDMLVRHFLCAADLMSDLLEHNAVHEVIEIMDLNSLRNGAPSSIDHNLSERTSDLFFTGAFKLSTEKLSTEEGDDFCLFFEHQSKRDRMMPFRNLEHITRRFRKYLNATSKANTKPGEKIKRKKITFPHPIAVTLYHGKRPWRNFATMATLVKKLPGKTKEILGFIHILIDVLAMNENEFRGHPANQALLACLHAASKSKLVERFEHILQLLLQAKHDPRIYNWLKAIICFVLSLSRPPRAEEIVFNAYKNLLNEEEAKKMAMSYNEELITKGRKEGRKEGRNEGRNEGKAEAIILALKTRLKNVPDSVAQKVMSYNDPTALESLMVLAVSCNTIEEFKEALKNSD